MNLSALAIRRPVATAMVAAATLLLGLVSLKGLNVDRFPDVAFPVVNVTATYPGASSTDVERAVTRPIEDAIAGINGIDRVRSFSRDSSSQTLVLFNFGTDPVEATAAVRERVSQARSRLPTEVKEPSIVRFDVAQAPVLTYALRGAGSPTSLRHLAEDRIKPALEQVEGVGSVEVLGGAKREIAVALNRVRSDAVGVSPESIAELLRASNTAAPVGRLDSEQNELSVRTQAELVTVDAVRDLRVAVAADGSGVRLGDIGSVRDSAEEQRSLVRVNGETAITLEVRKRSDANTLDLAERVKRRADALTTELRGQQRLDLLIDQSTLVRTDVNAVWFELVVGGLLAVLVVLVFMQDLRSMLIGALALLTSVVGSFLALKACGYTLNMMTMLGLSLAIGLLIDDAIVVRENITRHFELGASPAQAAAIGTKEIAPSVAATTLTVVTVFAPVAFLKGMVGQFFRQFGVTVSVAVLISLLVAFTVDPMLSAHFSKARRELDPFLRLKQPIRRALGATTESYVGLLRQVLARRWLVPVGISLVLVATVLAKAGLGSDFMPPEDRAQFLVDLEFEPGTSLVESSRRSRLAERELQHFAEVRLVYSTVGFLGEANRTRLRVLTLPKGERSASLADIERRASAALAPVAVHVSVTDPPFIEGFGAEAPIMIHVRGRTHEEVLPVAQRVAEILRRAGGIQSIELKSNGSRDELEVSLDRDRLPDAGVSAVSLAAHLHSALAGADAGKLRDEDEDVPIRVRYRAEDRRDSGALSAVSLPRGPALLRVSDLSKLQPTRVLQVIERENRAHQIPVWGVPLGRSLGDIAKEILPQIAALPLPSGASIDYVGELKLMSENNSNMSLVFGVGIACIYLLLAAQFESLIHPLTIMLTLPLGLCGAIVALFLSGKTLAMGSMIGILLLMGLVTKNAILLLDRVLHLQRGGLAPLAAVLQAAPERLRPILMTSATIVLGMLPTALATGEGSEFRGPMAIAVIGGVFSSTALSLLVVPLVYLGIERLRERLNWARPAASNGDFPSMFHSTEL